MSHEPALEFWLSYVERQGALLEDLGDAAVVLLTPELQRAFVLSEEVVVTSDPEAAREDGALLLIPGHPLLDQAVTAVLGEGDAGHQYLAWPRSKPPSEEELLRRARETFGVAHGRIDLAGEPAAVYLPLLRVGALVRYTLGDRFQEREDLWLDARSGVELAETVRRRLEAVPCLPAGEGGRTVLTPDVASALQAAQENLEGRATRRGQVLLGAVQDEMQAEIERAKAYYTEVLASIAQRRAAAAPERQALLDAQAEATRIERARRLQEIDEKFRAHHEVQPFRLHLLLAPGLYLPLAVRRGERRYPFGLGWLLHAGAFAPFRCPRCGAAAPLVAGREHLGCEACLPRPQPAQPEAPAPAPSPAPANSPAPSPSAQEPGEPAATRTAAPGPAGLPGAPARSVAAPASASRRPTPPPRTERSRGEPDLPSGEAADDAWSEFRAEYRDLRRRVLKAGERLAADFWGCVLGRTAWPAAGIASDSPLAALYRLYGPQGPFVAVGLPPGRSPVKLTSATLEPDPVGQTATCGELLLGDREGIGFTYTLRWRLRGKTPLLTEVLPFPDVVGTDLRPLDRLAPPVTDRLTRRVPQPRHALDGVAAHLWEQALPIDGLPLVLRCLSTWWASPRPDQTTLLAPDGRLQAVALVDEVGRWSGLRRTRAATAAAYGVDPRDLARAVREMRPLLSRRGAEA